MREFSHHWSGSLTRSDDALKFVARNSWPDGNAPKGNHLSQPSAYLEADGNRLAMNRLPHTQDRAKTYLRAKQAAEKALHRAGKQNLRG
jgi:hypothetical protein